MGVPTLPNRETSTCSTLPSPPPDLSTFTGLNDLDLTVIGQRLEPHRAVLDCQIIDLDDWCHHCGCQGRPIGTVIRRLAHAPFG